MGPNLSTVFLIAIIGAGGFGIVRVLLARHDPVGMASISIALLVGFVYSRLMISGHPYAARVRGSMRTKAPVELSSVARDTFPIFPGRPEGYVGYTDYTAMCVEVNDDLIARAPAEQFALLGFGSGFLQGLRDKFGDELDRHRSAIRMAAASDRQREAIGWLAHLQEKGVDNAGPSTENLHGVIRTVANSVLVEGPITMRFWDKVNSKTKESLTLSRTSSEDLRAWAKVHQEMFLEGRRTVLESASLEVDRR